MNEIFIIISNIKLGAKIIGLADSGHPGNFFLHFTERDKKEAKVSIDKILGKKLLQGGSGETSLNLLVGTFQSVFAINLYIHEESGWRETHRHGKKKLNPSVVK